MEISKKQIGKCLKKFTGRYFVYLVYRGGDVVYIGSSKNIYKRFKQHKYMKQFDLIEVIPADDMRDALSIERKMIFKYKPVENIFCKHNSREPDIKDFKYSIDELIEIYRMATNNR